MRDGLTKCREVGDASAVARLMLDMWEPADAVVISLEICRSKALNKRNRQSRRHYTVLPVENRWKPVQNSADSAEPKPECDAMQRTDVFTSDGNG